MIYNVHNAFEQLNDNDIKNFYKSKSQHLRYEIKNNVYNYIADNIDIKEEYKIFDLNFLFQKIERSEIELHGKSNNDISGALNGDISVWFPRVEECIKYEYTMVFRPYFVNPNPADPEDYRYSLLKHDLVGATPAIYEMVRAIQKQNTYIDNAHNTCENIINNFNSAISSALCQWTENYIKRVSK